MAWLWMVYAAGAFTLLGFCLFEYYRDGVGLLKRMNYLLVSITVALAWPALIFLAASDAAYTWLFDDEA